MDTVVRGGMVVTATGIDVMDVGVDDGKVASMGPDLPRAKVTIDATGCLVLPGAIDVHTHLHHWSEDVGSFNADDYESGTRAAAAGGITTIIDYSFPDPGGGFRNALERDVAEATPAVHIDFGLHPVLTAATDDNLRDISALSGEGFPSVKVFTAILPLPDHDLLKVLSAAAQSRVLVTVHAEDAPLIEYLTEENKRRGNTDVRYLPLSRPPIAEAIASHRVAAYAAHLGCPVYFVHVSSAAALDVLERIRAQGAELYIETRPAYLFLDSSRYELPEREGNEYVCLPPLRATTDRDAL